MMIRSNSRFLPILVGVAAPSLAYAIFDGGWNVDFNSDTVGQPPATAAYTDGAVNTAPKKISNVGVDTVLVTDALAGLDDQPVVLTNADATTGSGGSTSIPALEFGTGRHEAVEGLRHDLIGPAGRQVEFAERDLMRFWEYDGFCFHDF